jgi:hypothetical protein
VLAEGHNPAKPADVSDKGIMTFDHLLNDAELRPLLEARHEILFQGLASEEQVIQEQIDRLDYGDSYIVLVTKQPPGNCTKLMPRPDYQVNANPSRGLSTLSLAERPPSVLGPKGKPKKYAP